MFLHVYLAVAFREVDVSGVRWWGGLQIGDNALQVVEFFWLLRVLFLDLILVDQDELVFLRHEFCAAFLGNEGFLGVGYLVFELF